MEAPDDLRRYLSGDFAPLAEGMAAREKALDSIKGPSGFMLPDGLRVRGVRCPTTQVLQVWRRFLDDDDGALA